uniref:Gag-Pol polyprotein n=1 Tax=Tanacetum cinerariifolium TaxID=118510 RepID=A0A6L2MQM9_TANCI|nr:Gag-Pol polyprotein [Tanacetum cinerariifolium]
MDDDLFTYKVEIDGIANVPCELNRDDILTKDIEGFKTYDEYKDEWIYERNENMPWEKNAKLFNEWEKFTSTDEESIKSYYHRFMQLINDLKRNKHFSENIASNLKFLNNLQPEWKRHFTIVRQTKNLHEADFTQIYNFLKMNQEEVRIDKFIMLEETVVISLDSMLVKWHRISKGLMHGRMLGFKNGTGNVVAAKAEGTGNGNQARYPHLVLSMTGLPSITQMAQLRYILVTTAMIMRYSISSLRKSSIRIYLSPFLNYNYCHRMTTKSKEELFLLNVSNMVTVSKMISIPTEDLSDDTTPSVARKFLNEVKSSLVTLQHVVKQKMTLEVHNWSSSAHKEVHKIISHEIAPIINQVDVRVQNFEIQFLQKAAKFVRDFKSLAKEADESLDKQKSLELKIERLLKASVSHDIMSIVQNSLVDVPFDLRTELDRTKEKLKLCIIKKEKEYIVLWNNWYTKCKEKKYDKISYDKAYNDMQQKVERLQAQLRDLKGKSSNTLSVSNTLDPLNQKLKSKIVELEFQVLRARLFEKTFESVKNTSGMSVTSHCDKPKLSVVTPLSKMLHASMTSHSIPQPREFNVVKHRNLIAPRMFKINPSQTPRVDLVPNKQSSASIRTNPITNSQRHVTVKENVNSNTATASSKGLVHTGRTIRLQPKGNTKNARVPSASKSSEVKKIVTVEDHRRTLLLSNNRKTMSSKWSKERLTPKPRLPRFSLKWSPSGRSFDLKGKLVAFKETNCPSDDKARNIKLFINFVWKFLGTVRFGNDHIAAILGYGDLKWGNVTITRVYFVKGLGHNLFSVGQFCDADLEVAFRRNTCFIRDLDGVDLLKGNHSTNLYTINLHEMTSASPICLMARPTPTKSTKDETPEVIKNFLKKIYVRLQAPVIIVRTENGTEFKNQVLKEYFDSAGITHETSAAKTPQQNGVVERKNRTLAEAARTIKPDIPYLHVFEALCYLKNDREDIGKLDAKGNVGLFIRYSANFVAYRVYNWRTRKIMEMMNVMFDELSAMDFEQNSSRPKLQSFIDAYYPSHVYKLKKALYGLKQAPRAWYDELSTFLLQNGFSKGTIDPTFFTRHFDDDILVINQSPSGIFINQSKYVHEILKKYGLNTSDIVGTLMDIKDKLDLDQIRTPVDATKYHSMICALMCLTSSGPDMYMLLVYVLDTKLNPPKSTSKRLKGSFAIFEEPLIWVSGIRRILVLNLPDFQMLIMRDVKTPSRVLLVEHNFLEKNS